MSSVDALERELAAVGDAEPLDLEHLWAPRELATGDADCETSAMRDASIAGASCVTSGAISGCSSWCIACRVRPTSGRTRTASLARPLAHVW